MIVISMKRSSIVFLFFLLTNSLYAQKNDCNREMSSNKHKKSLPKEVCIPKGFQITYVYGTVDSIDFNRDGLNDYVFNMKHKNLSIGDTTFLVFYKRTSDTTYSFYKKFGNVIPIYFDPNIEGPVFKNNKLEQIFDCYVLPNPLNHMDIRNDTIEMIINLEPHREESMVYVYKFDKAVNDWALVKKTHYMYGEIIEEKILRNSFLSNFNYCE
jgi:hypothetical protein